jgi:hypothetical protein
MIRIKVLAPQSMNYDIYKEGTTNPQLSQNTNHDVVHIRQNTAINFKRSIEENDMDDELVNIYQAPDVRSSLKPNTMRSSDMFNVNKHRISGQMSGQNITNYKVKPSLMNQKIKKIDLQVDTDSRSKLKL